MEYMENTLKMRNKTKRNTILHKAKEPKGGTGPIPNKIGPRHEEKSP